MTYKLPKNKYKARSVTACENCGAVNVPLFTEILESFDKQTDKKHETDLNLDSDET